MRAIQLAALCFILASCRQELTFDERYEAAQKKTMKTADEIDAELEKARILAPQPSAPPELRDTPQKPE